ncbi:histidine kinase [Paenibacillus sepulcri]|uniref:Histidine kinase n=2 Tax=Paenibacillus sepulcri TaxID=359917 RepID=A0ABS7BWG7_9BACL|nr:histidine kinase [Paenibacillus sepulcri]
MMRIIMSSIFAKLVGGFLLAIVPMYIAGIFMNELGSQSVKHEISQSLSARSNFFMHTFEQELRSTDLLIHDLSQDSDMQKLSTIAPAMSRLEYYQAFDRIQNKMRLLKSSNQYITTAEAYIPLIEKTIQETSYLTALPQEQIDALERKSDGVLVEWNGRLQMGTVYPDYPRKNKAPNFAILTELNRGKLQDSLDKLVGAGGGGAALVGIDSSLSVWNDGSEASARQIAAELNEKMSTDFSSYETQLEFEGTRYWINMEKSVYLDTVLIVYVPAHEFLGPLSKHRVIFFGLSGFSLLVIIIFSYWIYNRIHQPLHRMVRTFRKMDLNNLQQIELHHSHEDEFRYLYEQFNQMVRRIRILIQEAYEQKIRSQRSELKQLQAQINPHFLYNSFFTLHQMAQMYDFDHIVLFTKHLGSYFKFITRNASDEVSLSAEVEHAKSYADIQSIRFQRRIAASWDAVPPGWEHREVPLLILQPLLENAYGHGLEEKERGGEIAIGMTEIDGQLHISIDDNGERLTDETLNLMIEKLEQPVDVGETTGLYNVHRRLQLKYGHTGGLAFSRSPIGGLQVKIILPGGA